jgi:hypothetical protein
LTLDAANNFDARGSSAASVRGDGGVEVRTGGVLGLDGGLVQVNNGPTCKQAARLGDTTFGTPDSSGNVIGSIVSGSGTVCIG